jgi:ribose 5-phosphate isomerase B
MKIYIGADHRGYKLKEKIKIWLLEKNYEIEDVGAYTLDDDDDYTTFAGRVASSVAQDEDTFGILACGSGVGVDVMANKFDGVRSSVGKEPEQVEAGRRDDDMNVLVIASDYTEEEDAREMVNKFLETEFATGTERYERRLRDIERVEEHN